MVRHLPGTPKAPGRFESASPLTCRAPAQGPALTPCTMPTSKPCAPTTFLRAPPAVPPGTRHILTTQAKPQPHIHLELASRYSQGLDLRVSATTPASQSGHPSEPPGTISPADVSAGSQDPWFISADLCICLLLAFSIPLCLQSQEAPRALPRRMCREEDAVQEGGGTSPWRLLQIWHPLPHTAPLGSPLHCPAGRDQAWTPISVQQALNPGR